MQPDGQGLCSLYKYRHGENMKRILTAATIISAFYFATAWAIPNPAEIDTPLPADAQMVSLKIVPDGIWEVSEDTVFNPKAQYINDQLVDEGELPADEKPFIALNRFEPVAVEFLWSGDVAIDLLLTQQEAAEIPNRIVISREDFDKANMKFLEKGGVFDLYAGYSVYQDEKEAKAGGGRTRSKPRMHYKGYGGCVAYVCKRVGCSGTVGNGKGMTNYLRKHGWHTVSCKSPKRGDVASWTGGSHGKGHCAIWSGGWCFDEGCFDPGRKYRLKDCVRR
jgi:hypothetical protein